MATVVIQKREREDGMSYVVTYKDPISGRKRYFKTFRKAKEAQQAANELRYLLDNGKPITSVKPDKKKKLMTVGEICELQAQHWIDRANKGDLSPDTVDGYLFRIRQITQTHGQRVFCEVTREEIEGYRDTVAANTSNVNANRIMFVFKQICAHGVKIGAIAEDPAREIAYLSEKAHERNQYVLPDGLKKLIEACQKVHSKYYLPAIILLGAEHGASKQEVLSLRWQDIDFNYAGTGLIRLFRTKNQRERTETLMPQTRAALLAWRDHLATMRQKRGIVPKDDTYVFCRLDGTKLHAFTSGWRVARKLAGFPELHFHDLRHTYCSNLLLVGADLKEVKDLIGHSDIKMTDRYTHLANAKKDVLKGKLAEHYEGVYPVR